MIESQIQFIMVLHAMAAHIHRMNYDHGFWPPEGRNKGEMIALIHSELSEMLEGVRKPRQDEHCPAFTSEEIELADAVIRILDYAYGHKLQLGEAIIAKMEYNNTRPFKHGKAF